MENQIPLIVDRRGTVLTLTFNNISKKNALNSEMMGAMTAAIEESSNYEELRAIVIRGEGSVFCSGADLNEWDPSQLQLFGLLYHDNLSELISTIEKGAPQAQKTIKSLLNGDILSKPMDERDRELETLISGIKEGKECQEGINSFMEKRKPEWVK